LLTTLAIFGKLAYPRIDVVGLMGREQMKESKIIEEFQEETRLETRRQDLVKVLDAKFGRRAAAEFAAPLSTVSDSDRLDRLLRLAVQSAGLEQFRDRFQKS
jgi:hypothetical protein